MNSETALPLDLIETIQQASLLHTYKGVTMIKNPFDLAIYSTLLWESRPRTIIEIGSFSGGSALWLADQLRAYNIKGHIYSLDIKKIEVSDPDVTFIQGDARDPEGHLPAAWIATLPRPLLVIEDADHVCGTTLGILKHFKEILHVGEYVVVEDGIISPMGDADKYGYDGGPARAIELFIAGDGLSYEVERRWCDYFGHNVTWNINGFLKKVR